MQFYDDWAKQILHGHWTDHQAFYGLPLYPVLLAVLYRIFGYSPFIPGLFQACFDAGTAALIYKITGCLLNRGRDGMSKPATVTGIVAAAGWCFFVPAQAYSAVLMPTAAATFVFWLLVWQIIRTEAAPSPRRCSAYGLLLGFAATGVAAILFLLPLFMAAIIIRQARMAAHIQAVALLLVGVIVGTAPCWIHNCFVARDPVFRQWHHQQMTFAGVYAWSENYVLPLSHDEVVHGKRSLAGKIPGDTWQRLATLRALYAFTPVRAKCCVTRSTRRKLPPADRSNARRFRGIGRLRHATTLPRIPGPG